MHVKKDNESHQNMLRLRQSIIIAYTIIIFFVIIIFSGLVVSKSDKALEEKVTDMSWKLIAQMRVNINSYISKMENTCARVFLTEEIYQYDPISQDVSTYEKIAMEEYISTELFDICIMENYVDFGIVYRKDNPTDGNHIVGKVSNGTIELFGDKLFENLQAMIDRTRTQDGWATGYNGNFKRIYYVKEIHENAVLVASFYTSELEEVFDHSGTMTDTTIYLLEENDMVIYSSQNGETGKKLDPIIADKITGLTSAFSIDEEHVINVYSCGDNWRLVCSVQTQNIKKENEDVRFFIVVVGLLTALGAILISVWISNRISSPVNKMVTVLDEKAHIDQLTGVLNKRSFEESADKAFHLQNSPEKYALILIDVDNFKGVNDTLGHAYGDKVLAGVGEILHNVFRADDFLGRLGGDEFCVLLYLPSNATAKTAAEYTGEKCRQLCEAFRNNYTGDDGKYKVSASIGAAFFPQHGSSFTELYQCADKALYQSKRKGKDTYTIYTEECK